MVWLHDKKKKRKKRKIERNMINCKGKEKEKWWQRKNKWRNQQTKIITNMQERKKERKKERNMTKNIWQKIERKKERKKEIWQRIYDKR